MSDFDTLKSDGRQDGYAMEVQSKQGIGQSG